jgi:CRP-like cAMP-binding protein
MTVPEASTRLRDNRLLALLDDGALAAVAPHLALVPLALRDPLLEEGQPIRHAWFPVDGVMSMVAALDDARLVVEVGTIGNEGMVGLPLFLGARHAPGPCFAQVAGAALRMPAAAFLRASQEQPAFARVLHRYTQALMVQMAQSVACNRGHGALERCARWLLMTRDRVGGDTFGLTQEFLGQMLGERRPTVSRVASRLQERGMIRYSRGHITILDRARLEQISCPCYRVIRGEYDAMLGGAHPAAARHL